MVGLPNVNIPETYDWNRHDERSVNISTTSFPIEAGLLSSDSMHQLPYFSHLVRMQNFYMEVH